jgi:hypothetical protein
MDMNRSSAWHQSTLELISNCSWRYFLTHVMLLPDTAGDSAKVGTAVHTCVEKYETNRMNNIYMSLDEMLDELLNMIDETVYPDMAAMGIAAVSNWYKATMKNKEPSHREWLAKLTPVSIEGYFNMGLVDNTMPIGGTIDGVYLDANNVYHVVDLKTSKDMSRWKVDGEGKRLQATMYSVAMQLKYNLDYLPDVTYTVSRTNYSGETSRRVIIYPDLLDVQVLGEKIREAQHIVDTENYVRNPSWSLCSKLWCPYYTKCIETGELCGTPESIKEKLLSQNVGDRQDNTQRNKTMEVTI